MTARRFDVAGPPSDGSLFVFNGDFVDRGAWGLETLLLFLAWKLALPRHVFLLRGNHETALCTMVYGFKSELVAKLGRGKWKVRGARGEGLCRRCTGAGLRSNLQWGHEAHARHRS